MKTTEGYDDDTPRYNKDHQRMIVDLMFMIIQNSRSFLAAVTLNAVTPTAVTPTAVILSQFT